MDDIVENLSRELHENSPGSDLRLCRKVADGVYNCLQLPKGIAVSVRKSIEKVGATASLGDDLGFDSNDYFEVIAALDKSGFALNDETLAGTFYGKSDNNTVLSLMKIVYESILK